MTTVGEWSLPVKGSPDPGTFGCTFSPLRGWGEGYSGVQPGSIHHTIYGKICNLLQTINLPVTSNYKNVILFCTTKQNKFWWYAESHLNVNRRIQYKITACKCKAVRIHWFTIGLCLKVAQVLHKMVQDYCLCLGYLLGFSSVFILQGLLKSSLRKRLWKVTSVLWKICY